MQDDSSYRRRLAAAARHWRFWIIPAILVVSVALRVACFVELNRGPCLWQHRWEETDMAFFDQWGRRIAAGDWIIDYAFHPYHEWHRVAAEDHFARHPEHRAELARQVAGDPGRTLWNEWTGGKRFHQEPLYAYLVGITYRVFGPDPRWVFAWQALLGVLTNILVYRIAQRLFGDVAGLISAALVCLCGPLLFHEFVLGRDAPLVFACVALVWLTIGAVEGAGWIRWLGLGVAGGLVFAMKSVAAPFLVGAAVVGTALRRVPWSGRVAALAALGCGAAIALAPAVARNLAVGVPPFELSSVNAYTFIAANAVDCRPDVGQTISRHTGEIMEKTGGEVLPTIVETLKTHPSPSSYIRMLAGKFTALWNWYEQPNNANFYYYRLHSAVLRRLPVTFLLLAPLALVGLVMALPTIRRSWPLYLMAASLVAVLMATVPLSRYRIALVAALVPFAGYALAQLAMWIRGHQAGRALATGAAIAAIGLWTARPLPAGSPLIYCSDYSAPYLAYYSPRALAAINRGDWAGAAAVLEESLGVEPACVKAMGPGRPARDDLELGLADLYSQVYMRYAEALRNAGKPDEATDRERRAAELRAAQGPVNRE